MKSLKRTEFGRVRQVGEIIRKHVITNQKDYLILSLILIIGIIIGVVLINNSDEANKQEIRGYISEFINTIKNENYEIDKAKLTKDIISSNFKIIILAWIAGTTIIGIPLIYLVTIYKGICFGYTISSIMITIGSWKGFIFSISALLIQNIVVIPILLAMCVSSIKMFRTIINREIHISIKQELIRHVLLLGIMLIPLLIGSIISSFISSSFMVYISKAFI